ncbi:MAG: helix-hairpin-helix domain-containing protein [Bacilli bacterium]|nr:helix-hairpin-helix domain-containing protein [Bacilli bacterium]
MILLISSLTIFLFRKDIFKSRKKDKKEETEVVIKKKEKQTSSEIYFKVDIKGQVNNPGIYSLKEGSRVIDVIEASGGLTENANTTVINLSKKIEDEMVIIIYSNEEVNNFSKTKEVEKQVIENCIKKDENSLQNDACINQSNEQSNTDNNLININTATQEELMTLSGIGESKAKDIITYRSENAFTSIEDIKNVPGIGESLFAKIKENITV